MKPQTAKTLIIMAVCALFVLFLASRSNAQGWWRTDVPMYHNPTGSPLSDADSDYLLNYVSWAWSQRSGRAVDYRGAGQGRSGGITVHWLDRLAMLTARQNFLVNGYAATQYRVADMSIIQADVYIGDWLFADGLNPCAVQTVMHEIGHAIGISGHSTDPADVMYRYSHCRYWITAGDVDLLHANYPANGCFAELTPEGDLYLPSVVGHDVHLRRSGAQVWDIQVSRQRATQGCSGALIGGHVELPDIRSMDGQWRGFFRVDGGVVTLIDGGGHE